MAYTLTPLSSALSPLTPSSFLHTPLSGRPFLLQAWAFPAMRLLEEEGKSLSAWMRAARRGDPDSLRSLAPLAACQQLPPRALGAGAGPPAASGRGRVSSLEARPANSGPALFVASEYGHAEAILVLLGMGAKVSITRQQVSHRFSFRTRRTPCPVNRVPGVLRSISSQKRPSISGAGDLFWCCSEWAPKRPLPASR